ncbi:hypothetical protein FPV67DRAFT_1776479 [Lyophyllum atratum]|nr:hypothetical protein FPV67DRAFT_1776479 [Lyophyllum atratum]
MSSALPSVKFAEIFDSLPPGAQRTLLEKHLFPVLDTLPKANTDHVLSAATESQTRLRTIPKFDLKSKKKEFNHLMNALIRDSKIAITKDRSIRDELLGELVDSLTSWLNDIWSAVYEFRDNYAQAHACLLLAADVSSTLIDIPGLGGCKCSLMNMPIDITIKKENGKVVKTFALRGPQMLGKAILWIWRELFVSLFAYGTALAKKKTPEMIEDIEAVMGWESLERLLYGGGASTITDYGDLDDEDHMFDLDEEDDDEDEDYVDEDDDDEACQQDELGGRRCACSYHASHWSDLINEQRIPLRELVENRLHATFRTMPSTELYHVIHAISPDFSKTERLLIQETNENATKSSDTLAGALAVYSATCDAQRIVSLLNSHYHLLRPRDSEVLRDAVAVLATSGHQARGLQILEAELLDTIRTIQAAVTSVFGNIESETHKSTVQGILKLRGGSQERLDRINSWMDAVLTAVPPLNPVALAAMMMGIPVGDVEETGQEDIASFLDDLDPSDTDWDDLREEFRPPLKERFDGWYQVAENFNDSMVEASFVKIYYKTTTMMPFMRSADIAEHMVLRLTELQGKNHIARGLQALIRFCVTQRKQISAGIAKERRAAKKAAAGARNTTPSSSDSTSTFPFPFQSPLHPSTSHTPFRGIDDVD